MAINIILNLLLVPKISFIGSAWSWFITNLAWFALTIYWADKLIDYSKKLLLVSFSKAVLASLIMGAVLFYIREQVHIFVNVALGGIVYVAVMFLIKGITITEIKELINSLGIKRSQDEVKNF